MSAELLEAGYPVQFVVVANEDGSYFLEETKLPIFQDTGAGQPSWDEMGGEFASKHDTFVYDQTGELILFWDASADMLDQWKPNIREAVESAGK